MPESAHEDYRQTVREMVNDAARFVQLTLKGKVRGGVDSPWRMIQVRPVLVKGARHLQFSYYDQKQHITHNHRDDAAQSALDEVLHIPYSSINVRTTAQDLHVQLTKKGKTILHYSDPPPGTTLDLSHDHQKALPLPDGTPDAYLQAVGIMTEAGKVRPKMRAKFNQINEFLKLLEHTGELDRLTSRPLRIVDFGCGAAYLTLAAYHYLNAVRGIPAMLDGVDSNGDLIDKNTMRSRDLGYEGTCFTNAHISDFALDFQPDIVIALHACDTATDDTLAQGILNGAGMILAAPCCHNHLHKQLTTTPDALESVMRHGILKKRMADIVTDSFRALILRIYGYSTDVIEFIASEHTDRNLMIRALRRDPMDTAAFVTEYRALKAMWNVTPYLETALGDSFAKILEKYG